MQHSWHLLTGLCLALCRLAAAAPPPSVSRAPRMTCHSQASAETWASSAPVSSSSTSSSWSAAESGKDCLLGGACDCSRIKDKNGEEYFQCVTDPYCERCWVSVSGGGATAWATGTSRMSGLSSSAAANTTTAQRTVTLWTHSGSAASTTVAADSSGATEEPSSTSAPTRRPPRPGVSSSSPRVVTVVETMILTVDVASATPASSADDSTATDSPDDQDVECPEVLPMPHAPRVRRVPVDIRRGARPAHGVRGPGADRRPQPRDTDGRRTAQKQPQLIDDDDYDAQAEADVPGLLRLLQDQGQAER
ncbi:hypothetical protein HIM_05166 [Hirsutella minnesotensis 3608]|uniref:Uncharacterized protein n=1 Tax=Hirsutella minnesotensis 3608 TaxID=1043627 RepID=A0A0F7ZPG7_9HYPO|nr:hypothetical protein HIM_05166 [Hirsutella minnesotensis 3608]